jgi:hypothetical protein
MHTLYRQPVGREFSYPVGLADLRQRLDGVPHGDELEVTFCNTPGSSASRFRASIARQEPTLVLQARFTKLDKAPSRGDDLWMTELLHGKWSLSVYPVARQHRSLAHQALVGFGLLALADWLRSTRPDSWYHGRKVFDISFDPLEGHVYWREHAESV